ncbi:unnamed protein product [Medioppia subpectinata]|uniref:Uncharacterized protein n=1 Tax=Medioppia subpectinata TaxID=1979941 RepID=A0A7R9KJE8_9ACAR|nr:unnamed protein product [Medioppia subpectinata]CAG2104637.1 unnamed protein product [Medioppia subpectinata]
MPMQLEMVEVLSDSVILRWVEGFNGGFGNTEYVVTYNDGELAKIEIRSDNNGEWRQLTTVPIISNQENVYLKSTAEEISDIRVILCLQSNDSWCGYEHLVKMDSIYARETKSLTTDHLLTVIMIASVSALAVVVTILCCCWRRKDKSDKKDYESDSTSGRPKVTTISQPFYASHDNKGLMADVDTSKLSPPMYSPTGDSLNGHIPQNYYLTGEDNDPSPGASSDTAQIELWNMIKSDMMSDNPNDNGIPYHPAYGTAQMQMDPNGYLGSYGYYPHEGYQPLNDDNMNMNRKNNMQVGYYEEMGANPYGTAMGMEMMNDPISNMNDPNLMPTMDPSNMNHIPYEEEMEYSTNRNGRVIREIIV